MSQGQRFRRRALRRGYKVDEVDTFLDRVEATINGDPGGDPVSSAEVHDVVFRVRFGGYDEWQVDLHLDRVERQLGEVEEHGPARSVPVPERVPAERMIPERMGPDRMPAGRLAPAGEDRMMPAQMPMRDDRSPVAPMRDDRLAPPMRDDRMMPMRDDRSPAPPMRDDRMGRPVPPAPVPGRPGARPPAGFDRYDDPTFAGPSFDGFEPGRHGKTDMTTEIRMPADLTGPARSMPGGPAPGGSVSGGSVSGGSVSGGSAHRVDELRRTFQPRRFGSGYDPRQVDRLFENLMAAVSGRAAVSINDAELDPKQFDLVPNGYFEAEVDQALREVRDILHRR